MSAKSVTSLVLVVLCSIAARCSARSEQSDREPSLPQLPYVDELQAAIDGVLLASQHHDRLGISAAVIVPGYRPWTGVSGNSQPGVPITADMVFDAGSVEKNLEAALVLRLAEEGTLSLDDPISKYLPAFPNVDSGITIRQLLNHTSGVFNVFEHPDFPWVRTDVDYSKRWELGEALSAFVLEPYGPPGYAQHYSSTNYLLLTAIIEKAAGAPVPDLIEGYFLSDIGLEHTLISMGDPPPADWAVAHPWVDLDLDGDLEDLSGISLAWKVSLTHPVIFATAQDLARWMHALYHQRSVLGSSSMTEMLTYPEVALLDPEGARYGLGVVDYSDALGMQAVGHGGSSLGYSAAALYLPEYDVSLAWLINTGESPAGLASQLMSSTWSALSEVLTASLEP